MPRYSDMLLYSWCVGPVHDQYIAQMFGIYGLKGRPTIIRALPLPRTKGHVLVSDLSTDLSSEANSRCRAAKRGRGPDHDLRDRSWYGDLSEDENEHESKTQIRQ